MGGISGVFASGCDSCGWPFGSSSSGTETFARVALAAETSLSPVGPACAGAIVVAVSAAQISSAERKEAKRFAVNVR